MSPPLPPSPPSGPPLETCASRRKEPPLAPPFPAFTWSCASSTKPAISQCYEPVTKGPPDSVAGSHHVDEAPALAAAEFHLALGKSEKGVVSATSHVLTRVEPGTALTDDDRSRRNGRAVENLDA